MPPDPRPSDAPTTRYEVDRHDRIRFVDEGFTRFARENGADDLEARVLGASLWTFLSGPEALHIYGILFERTRRTGVARSVPFRCDAPGLRREMELTIEAVRDGGLALTTRVLCVERRDDVALLDGNVPRSSDVVRMCGWCKRTSVEGVWVEVEEALPAIMRSASGHLPRLTHAACPECERSLLAS